MDSAVTTEIEKCFNQRAAEQLIAADLRLSVAFIVSCVGARR